MNTMNKIKKALSLILVFVLVATLLPMPARAADASRTADTIFFATDRHQEPSKLNSLLKALPYTPGLVALGGDNVNNQNSYSLADVTEEIQSVYPGVQTFYTYGSHDSGGKEDASNPYAFARTGEYYEGEDYYVYAVDQDAMSSSSTASSASSAFKSWASGTAKEGKIIFVLSHMPIHDRRGDNAGGATWLAALNEVGKSHDVVFLWGHNHTGEGSADTSVFYVAPGGSITPEGGSKTTINFTYMNAGYIKNGYATMALINDETVAFVRYNTSGSVVTSYTMTRQFAAHTHSYSVTGSVSATCGTAGSVTYSCACGESYTETVAATGAHAYTSVTTGATCVTAGSVKYTCTGCGYSYTETVAATGHSYTAVTVPATCTEDGSVTYTCGCGDSYTEVIPSTGEHVYESVTVEATCSKEGSVTYTCGCGESYTEVIAALGHSYESVVTEVTCEKDGFTTHTCGNCGDSYVTDKVEALGHAYTAVVTAATCEKDGYTTYTCGNCGNGYVTDEVEALGHAYTAIVTAATCEKGGYTTNTCGNCGASYVTDEVEALGHRYNVEETEDAKIYTCSNCGDSYIEEVKQLSYDRVTKFTSGDSYVITVYSSRKYYALTHAGNKISAVQVTVSNGKITSEISESMLWKYSGSKLSYEDNGTTYYLYAGNSQSWYGSGNGSMSLSVSTSKSSTVSFSSNKLKVGSYYLRYSNGTIQGNRSGSSCYLFQQNEE